MGQKQKHNIKTQIGLICDRQQLSQTFLLDQVGNEFDSLLLCQRHRQDSFDSRYSHTIVEALEQDRQGLDLSFVQVERFRLNGSDFLTYLELSSRHKDLVINR